MTTLETPRDALLSVYEPLELEGGNALGYPEITGYSGGIAVAAVCMMNDTKPCAAPNACAMEGFCQYP